MDPLKALEAKVDALETKLERRITATSARKLAHVHLLIAAETKTIRTRSARFKTH